MLFNDEIILLGMCCVRHKPVTIHFTFKKENKNISLDWTCHSQIIFHINKNSFSDVHWKRLYETLYLIIKNKTETEHGILVLSIDH